MYAVKSGRQIGEWGITHSDWAKFIEIMDSLATSIANGEHISFKIDNISYSVTSHIPSEYERENRDYDDYVTMPIQNADEVFTDADYHKKIRNLGKRLPGSGPLMDRLASYAIKECKESAFFGPNGVVELFPNRILELQYGRLNDSQFVKNVLNATGEQISSVPSLISIYRGAGSLLDLIQILLVNFDMEFSGFDRIKRCQNCGNICLENHKHKRKYCSEACKSAGNRRNEGEKAKCRDRNNSWLNNQFSRKKYAKKLATMDKPNYYLLWKDHCQECQSTDVKKGQCAVLRQQNPDAFQFLDKLN
jgi:hypothetical protein